MNSDPFTTVSPMPTPMPIPAPPLPPETTAQEDITTAGQRQINLIWERTQSAIALSVVFTTMAIGGWVVVYGKSEQSVSNLLAVAFGTVIGFYFARTNHAAIGGVGRKPSSKYEGR